MHMFVKHLDHVLYQYCINIPTHLLQDATKRRIKDESSARLRQKQQKLDMLKNIINERDSELDSMSTASSVSSAPNTLPRRAHTRVYTEPNLAAYSGRPPVTPRTTPHRPAVSVYSQQGMTRRLTRARSPPPVKPVRMR